MSTFPPVGIRVEAIRARIAAGDVYQVNLAHRFSAEVRGAPAALYQRLREVNPAPFMGYAAWEGGALLSASPHPAPSAVSTRLRTCTSRRSPVRRTSSAR